MQVRILVPPSPSAEAVDREEGSGGLRPIHKREALHDLTGEQTQEGKAPLGTYYFRTNEYQKAVDCLKTGLAAAPESERSPMIQYMFQQAEQTVWQSKRPRRKRASRKSRRTRRNRGPWRSSIRFRHWLLPCHVEPGGPVAIFDAAVAESRRTG